MEKDIKDYRDKELKTFVLVHMLLVLVDTGLIDDVSMVLNVDNVWAAVSVIFSSSIISTIAYTYIFIMDSIAPSSIKDRIIYPIKGKPGNRIFEEIQLKDNDDRFSAKMAEDRYHDVYQKLKNYENVKDKAKEQNSAWFELYQKYEKYSQVFISQRDFLLFRDMTAIMPWILIAVIVISFYLKRSINYWMLVFILVETFLVWLCARSKGWRFAYNVIAKDLGNRTQ